MTPLFKARCSDKFHPSDIKEIYHIWTLWTPAVYPFSLAPPGSAIPKVECTIKLDLLVILTLEQPSLADVIEVGLFLLEGWLNETNLLNSSNSNPWFQVEGRNDDKTMKHMDKFRTFQWTGIGTDPRAQHYTQINCWSRVRGGEAPKLKGIKWQDLV